MTMKGRYVNFDDNIFNDGHVTGTLALPAPGVTVDDDTVVTVEGLPLLNDTVVPVEDHDTERPLEVVTAKLVHTQLDAVAAEEDNREVRRSLLVPRRFRDRLIGANGCLLESMQDHYSVTLFEDAAQDKLHTKGTKNNVLESYAQLHRYM